MGLIYNYGISKTGLYAAIAIFFICLILYLIFVIIKSKTKINSRLSRLDSNKSMQEQEQKGFALQKELDKLDGILKDAEMKIPVNQFLFIILVASIATYVLGFLITKTWLVPIGLLPFPLYFIPDIIITNKRDKITTRFNTELVLVLRRMSAITKNDSILRALEDVKDYPVYSEKMRVLLNTIYQHFSYGDSIEEAFRKVAATHPSKLLNLTAISIDINKSLGSDLSLNLHEISMQIQSNMLMKKEAKAIMTQTVMTGRALSFLPYMILGFLFIYNENYFSDYFAVLSNQFVFALILFVMSIGVFVVAKMSKPPEA